MNGIAKAIIIGNLGRDPDLRTTKNGNSVANFSVACNTGWGEEQKVEWVNVVAWKKTAEVCEKYLRKGSPIYVEGRLETQKYEDKEGVTRYKTQVVAERVVFIGKKGDQPEDEGRRDDNQEPPSDDSDIPF